MRVYHGVNNKQTLHLVKLTLLGARFVFGLVMSVYFEIEIKKPWNILGL